VIATQQIPDDIETLLAAFKNVPAFVASIIVLGIFWRGHWLWSRRYGLEDGVSIFISWAMIVTMLIYIYPLKAIFSSMWFLLSGGRVGHVLGAHSESQVRCSLRDFCIRIRRYRTGDGALEFACVAIAGAVVVERKRTSNDA
jgi:hypothetical protein